MHILLAFLTTLASVLWALDRLGIDLGWFNPWSWQRRRRWQKQYHANPAFSLESPVEAIALLLTATAKIDGDLSLEEKLELKKIFENSFHLSAKDASELLNSSVFLLGTGQEVFKRPKDVLVPNLEKFTSEQKNSSMDLLKQIANVGGSPSEPQQEFISNIKIQLIPEEPNSDWG